MATGLWKAIRVPTRRKRLCLLCFLPLVFYSSIDTGSARTCLSTSYLPEPYGNNVWFKTSTVVFVLYWPELRQIAKVQLSIYLRTYIFLIFICTHRSRVKMQYSNICSSNLNTDTFYLDIHLAFQYSHLPSKDKK